MSISFIIFILFVLCIVVTWMCYKLYYIYGLWLNKVKKNESRDTFTSVTLNIIDKGYGKIPNQECDLLINDASERRYAIYDKKYGKAKLHEKNVEDLVIKDLIKHPKLHKNTEFAVNFFQQIIEKTNIAYESLIPAEYNISDLLGIGDYGLHFIWTTSDLRVKYQSFMDIVAQSYAGNFDKNRSATLELFIRPPLIGKFLTTLQETYNLMNKEAMANLYSSLNGRTFLNVSPYKMLLFFEKGSKLPVSTNPRDFLGFKGLNDRNTLKNESKEQYMVDEVVFVDPESDNWAWTSREDGRFTTSDDKNILTTEEILHNWDLSVIVFKKRKETI